MSAQSRRRLKWLPLAGAILVSAGCPAPAPDDGGTDSGRDVQGMDTQNPNDVQNPIDVQNPVDGGVMAPPTTGSLLVNCGADCSRPLDAVPNSTGTQVFFTAFTPTGQGGVFRVVVASQLVTPLTAGFEYPVGIAISDDDQTLYITDQTAVNGTRGDVGAVYTTGTDGGPLTPLNVGTQLVNPTGVTVVGANLLITGINSATGKAGLFRVPATGGSATLILEDLRDPSGVTQSGDGTVFVLDTTRDNERQGNAVRQAGDATLPTVGGFTLAYPAGIAHSYNGDGYLVSGTRTGAAGKISWVAGTDVTSTALLSTGMVEPTGLHRARNLNVWAVADDQAGPNSAGAIFLVR